MRKKYDWQNLKIEFVSGKWLTISTFCQDRGVRYNGYARSHTAGWLEEKKHYQDIIQTKVRDSTISEEIEIRLRQLHLARKLQEKGQRKLKGLPIKNAEQARKLIVSGMEQERIVLGIDKASFTTDVKVDLPKTRLDDLMEKMNYEELIEFAAELKRKKQEWAEGQKTIDDSSSEAHFPEKF